MRAAAPAPGAYHPRPAPPRTPRRPPAPPVPVAARLPTIQLPTIQNWTCNSCAGCCREHLIEVTPAERDRLLAPGGTPAAQGWTAATAPGGVDPVVPLGGPSRYVPGKWLPGRLKHAARHRLNHAAGGACVFLRDDGLCAVHKEYGEAAKPLACRVYPYALHPARRGVTVSLRFSCPTVAANGGRPVTANAADVREIARAVLPAGFGEGRNRAEPPPVAGTRRVGWPAFDRITGALAGLFTSPDPAAVQVLRAVYVASLLDRADLSRLDGRRLGEFLEVVSKAAADELPAPADFDPPTAAGAVTFRGVLARYAKKDVAADLSAGWARRLGRVLGGARVAFGKTTPPGLWAGPVPTDELFRDAGPPPAGADELFARYYRVKLEGLAFCGPAFDGWPLTDGFFALALVHPVAVTLARWRQLAEGREEWTLEDVRAGLRLADHHHGYDPGTTGRLHRRQVRSLHRNHDLAKLIARCGR